MLGCSVHNQISQNSIWKKGRPTHFFLNAHKLIKEVGQAVYLPDTGNPKKLFPFGNEHNGKKNEYVETCPRSSPSETRVHKTDMPRPGIKPEGEHSSK
jgi:hypothetical protein